MQGKILIAIGAVLMVTAIVAIGGWVTGRQSFNFSTYSRKKSNVPANPDQEDGEGDADDSRNAVFEPILYFLVMIVGPLLGGAVMIAYGLHRLH